MNPGLSNWYGSKNKGLSALTTAISSISWMGNGLRTGSCTLPQYKIQDVATLTGRDTSFEIQSRGRSRGTSTTPESQCAPGPPTAPGPVRSAWSPTPRMRGGPVAAGAAPARRGGPVLSERARGLVRGPGGGGLETQPVSPSPLQRNAASARGGGRPSHSGSSPLLRTQSSAKAPLPGKSAQPRHSQRPRGQPRAQGKLPLDAGNWAHGRTGSPASPPSNSAPSAHASLRISDAQSGVYSLAP